MVPVMHALIQSGPFLRCSTTKSGVLAWAAGVLRCSLDPTRKWESSLATKSHFSVYTFFWGGASFIKTAYLGPRDLGLSYERACKETGDFDLTAMIWTDMWFRALPKTRVTKKDDSFLFLFFFVFCCCMRSMKRKRFVFFSVQCICLDIFLLCVFGFFFKGDCKAVVNLTCTDAVYISSLEANGRTTCWM